MDKKTLSKKLKNVVVEPVEIHNVEPDVVHDIKPANKIKKVVKRILITIKYMMWKQMLNI